MYGEYNSLTEAAKILNSSLKTISRCLKTEKKQNTKKTMDFKIKTKE